MIFKAPAERSKRAIVQSADRSGYALRSDWPSCQAAGRDWKTLLFSICIYGRYIENLAERIPPSHSRLKYASDGTRLDSVRPIKMAKWRHQN